MEPTPEWHEVRGAMRNLGDAQALVELRALTMKDKMDQTTIAMEATDENGWTLLHIAALFGCVECGRHLLADERRGGRSALALIARTTKYHASTAAEIAGRWQGGESFVRVLLSKKHELEKIALVASGKRAVRDDDVYDDEDFGDGGEESPEGWESTDEEGRAEKVNNPDNDAELHGGRSSDWWSVWRSMHVHSRRRGAASILKELLKKPIFLSTEAGACSTRAETLNMTLLHHACLTGALDCAALLLRARLGSGVFLFEDPDGLFDVRGRTPEDCARQFHKLKVLEVLSDARAARWGHSRLPPVPRGSMRTAQWWAVWRALAVSPAVEAAEHLEEFLQLSETEIGSGGGSNDHGGFVATARATTAKSSRNHSKGRKKDQGQSSGRSAEGTKTERALGADRSELRLSSEQQYRQEVRLPADVGAATGRTLLWVGAANGNVVAVEKILRLGWYDDNLTLVDPESARREPLNPISISHRLQKRAVLDAFEKRRVRAVADAAHAIN